MEVMPSYDLGDVFDGFVNVMHYDGLDCYLDIPEIYIPEIPNVTQRVVLYSGGTINFKDYFDMIPDKIILVVRAILTIALILFSFTLDAMNEAAIKQVAPIKKVYSQ